MLLNDCTHKETSILTILSKNPTIMPRHGSCSSHLCVRALYIREVIKDCRPILQLLINSKNCTGIAVLVLFSFLVLILIIPWVNSKSFFFVKVSYAVHFITRIRPILPVFYNIRPKMHWLQKHRFYVHIRLYTLHFTTIPGIQTFRSTRLRITHNIKKLVTAASQHLQANFSLSLF